MSHGRYKRVHCTSILEVTYEVDVEVFKRPLRLVDRKEVEETLWRVHVCSVASVDDGHRCYLACILRSSLNVVAHGNDVGIVAHHENGVFERLTFRHAWGFSITEAYNLGSQPVGSCLKTETCACWGFKKEGCYYFSFEKFSVGMFLKFCCHLNKVHNLVLVQVGDCHKIVSHLLFLKKLVWKNFFGC